MAAEDLSNVPGLTPDTMALIAGMLVIFFLALLVLHLFVAVALIFISKKTNTDKGWLGFIPFANFYLMTKITKTSPWLALIPAIGMPVWLVVPYVGFIGFLAIAIWMIWMEVKLCKARGKSGWFVLLNLIPGLGFFAFWGWLAWSK